MKAVNLVPAELRGGGAPSRSGGAVYVVLGALAVALLLVTVSTLLGGRVADREAQVAGVEAEATAAEQRAAAVTRYKALAADTSGRVTRVRTLVTGRVDWSAPFADVARTVGTEVRFASITATSAPGVSAGGADNPLRAALPVPAVSIAGCARDHAAVARLVARLRAMDGVTRVSLSSSARKDEQAAGARSDGGTASGGAADCTSVADRPADFAVVAFLAAPAAPATAPSAGAPAGGTATTTAATPSETTP
jgi:Tfp pilus assembly protein PilN